MRVNDYCRTCRELTLPNSKDTCLWCDGKLTPKPKPRGAACRISDADLQVLHGAYLRTGMSLRAIGSKIKKRYGYSSTESAAMALQSGFERLHLERRNHVELMRQRNRKHGRYEADRNMARRYRRRETGEVRDVRCEGVRQNYPDKGARCSRPALNGSTFCWAHDPVGKADRDQHLKSMRAQADK